MFYFEPRNPYLSVTHNTTTALCYLTASRQAAVAQLTFCSPPSSSSSWTAKLFLGLVRSLRAKHLTSICGGGAQKRASVCKNENQASCGCLSGMSDDVLESGRKVHFGAMNAS